MINEYYRITCNGIGIYECLKRYLFNNFNNGNEFWTNFVNSEDVKWLKKPTIYDNSEKEYYSFFNLAGYELFLEKTLPLITKWIDKDTIKIDKVKIEEDKIAYQDQYQIVVEITKEEKARKFCSDVKKLAEQYNLSFFVVTEGASATLNDNCEAVKHARDCHIEWEKQHNFNPFEDWEKDNI